MHTLQVILLVAAVALLVLAAFGLPSLALLAAACALLAYALPTITD